MSSSSGKLVLGIILGAMLGVTGGFLYYDPKIQNLEYEIGALSVDAENSESALADLSAKYSKLSSDYNMLLDRFDVLLAERNSIQGSYDEMETAYDELLDDYEVLVAALPLSPEPVSGVTLEKNYNWSYRGRSYSLSLSIPESQYSYYRELERAHTSDYSVYVTHPYDDEYINTIIRKFNLIALETHLTEEDKVNLVISFVQSLPYTVDSVTTSFDEYPRYPLETLVDDGGDCEDTSILTASLLKAMNYDVILIAPPEHMAVGVSLDSYGSYWEIDSVKYFYLETTGEGWQIGEYPDDLEKLAYTYELNPVPMCVHEWTSKWNGYNRIDVTITTTNLGSAMAEGYKVYAAFDSEGDYVWNPEESQVFNLNIGKSYTATLTLDVPSNEHTRLIVEVINAEGYYVDISYSDWFDT